MACKCKQRYLASPETKEVHTQLTMECCFSPVRLAEIKTKWYLVLRVLDTWCGAMATQAHTCRELVVQPSCREDHAGIHAIHP